MKQITYKLLFILLLCPLLVASQKWDYQWPMGYWYGAEAGIPDIALLDFTGDTVALYGHAFSNHLGFGASASFICDSLGQLQLVTNNCAVFDEDFLLVPGSDTLTPGWGFENHCDVQSQSVDGYVGKQLTVFLPELGNDSTVYLAHKDNIIFDSFPIQDVLSTKLYLSTFVRKADGTYYLKEKRKLAQGLYNAGHLTACLHADGQRWWTNMVEYNSNKIDWFLVSGQDTVQGPFVQEIGNPLLNQEIDIGQVAFSPDASMLAYNSDLSKIFLYGFDNAMGQLSNPQEVPYSAALDNNGLGVGFSFDSRFLYATSSTDLFQIDLWEGNAVEHIAHHESLDEDHWPVGMGNITLGPDCRMYISPGSTTYYIHVVHHPNEKGAACGFEARALRSSSSIDIDFPNLPMYRFDGACDSTIAFPYKDTVSATVGMVVGSDGVEVFPNPCVDYFTVSFPEQAPRGATLLLFDGLGRPCLERQLPALSNVFDVGGLAPGVYFYEIREGTERMQGGKLVRVE